MNNIIEIGDRKFKRKWSGYCGHKSLEYDTTNETVKCTQCEEYISGFAAFVSILNNYSSALRDIDSQKKELAELEKKHVVLKAAKSVESAWRSRSMVPTCPHCHEAIFPGDRFGWNATNKQQALEARKFKGKKAF